MIKNNNLLFPVFTAKHGFKKAIVPAANVPREKIPGMEVIGVKKLEQALSALHDL